jgi:hypothetical protein
MNAVNLMNRVTKTVTSGLANTAKRTAADRVGTGFMAVAMPLPPAEFLSPGQSLSQRPHHEPQPGSRQEEVSAMRYPLIAVAVGRVSGPVVRRTLFAQWAKQANQLSGTPPMAGTNRQIHSWPHCSRTRIGSDCQSPDRRADRTDRKRGLAAARMSRPSAATAK